MSLGFEVDFLAVIGLVHQVRKSFVGAPEQFRAISDDVRGFSIVLQDVEASCTELSSEQSQEYLSVVTSCKHLLEQLKKTIEEYASVEEGGKTGKKTAIKRVWKRLKWEPDDIRDIRSQISVKIATLKSLNDQVISHNIAKLVRHQEDAERVATLKRVSDINYVAQQNDIFLRCQTGSRKWLFESEVYLEWLRRKGSVLFCPGNPGTGKTFTTAMVVESLRLANDAETLTTYMYCTYQNHTQTIEKLLCSLLRVALEEADHEADGTVSTCKQLWLTNKAISRQHCLNQLQDLFSRFTRVNLIVDALDELTNEVRRPLINDLLKLHGHSHVSLLVTSRGIPEIQHLFENCEMYTTLEVRSSDEDIRNFLRDNIFQLPNFVARSQKLQDEVINSVTNASAGMFLLAELYLKSLASIISVGNLRTRLSNLATGSSAYDTLYEDSMLRIGFQGPESERIAVRMLLVLTCARRPLSPQELSHALSIDESSEAFDEDMVPDMDDLIAACTGLVVLDGTSNVVHLVHKSAAEYFERTRSRWFPRANETMAFMCLRYLQVAETNLEEIRREELPFFHYAKANWSYHSMESEKEAANDTATGDASLTNSATENGTSPNRLAVTQLAIQQMTREVVDVHSSIVEACHAGHQAWVEQLLVVRSYDMNIRGRSAYDQEIYDKNSSIDLLLNDSVEDDPSSNETFRDDILLTIAAARGDYSMARMLLARGADPNILNAKGQTPLFIATIKGFDGFVSLLLDQKSIKPDLMCWHSGGLSTAFLTSIRLKKLGCFKILLERANRSGKDGRQRSAMCLAAAAGYSDIIPELLKWPEAEMECTDTDFCDGPLAAAIRGGQEDTALFLWTYIKCQSCCSICGITPIHYAVRKGFHDLLKQLLEHDASIADRELDIQLHQRLKTQTRPLRCEWDSTKHTKTPLINAICLQDVQATQLLLQHANVNQGGTWRPLHEAAEVGNAEIFELLLKQVNIEPDPVDEDDRTPFLVAAEFGNCDIMNALIKHGGVQFDRRDALRYAADDYIINNFQNIDYFRILASVLDIEVIKKDPKGSSLLHRACSLRPKISFEQNTGNITAEAELLETNSGPLVAELLKRSKIDVNLLDCEGKTALLLAVENHQRDVVRLLLEREDTDVLVQDKEGNDALLLASVYEPISRQLYPGYNPSMKHTIARLRGQVPTRYKVGHWQEVLNVEFKEYAESIFSMLIRDERTNPYLRNKKGESIMLGVAMTGTKSMVQAVLETNGLALGPEIIYLDGKHVLSLALQSNPNDGVVDLLIPRCTTSFLQEADSEGRTPLLYAVQRASSRATRSLLAAGVDTNVTDPSGLTPLSYAMNNKNPDAACLLIAVDKTQINVPDCDGLTPLLHATRLLNIPIISALLDRSDIDVLALDEKGHPFLCHFMKHTLLEGRRLSESALHRINHHLQFRNYAIKANIHSPYICLLESAEWANFIKFKIGFNFQMKPGRRRQYFGGLDESEEFEESFQFRRILQRYAIILESFHAGLDLTRCGTKTDLWEILGEDIRADFVLRELYIRVLRLYDNRNTYIE